jgi:hypothetical protein
VHLADGHEGYAGDVAVGSGAGLGDLGSDVGEVFGDGHLWVVYGGERKVVDPTLRGEAAKDGAPELERFARR